MTIYHRARPPGQEHGSQARHLLRSLWLGSLIALALPAPASARAPDIPLRCVDERTSASEAVDKLAHDFRPAVTPRIFLALGKDSYPVLKKVLAAGDNPNVCHAGMSPLMLAVASGDAPAPAQRATQLTLAARLLRAQVPINALHVQGSTALGMAIAARNVELAGYLIEQYADASIRNKQGEDALSQARRLGDPAMIALLERHQAASK